MDYPPDNRDQQKPEFYQQQPNTSYPQQPSYQQPVQPPPLFQQPMPYPTPGSATILIPATAVGSFREEAGQGAGSGISHPHDSRYHLPHTRYPFGVYGSGLVRPGRAVQCGDGRVAHYSRCEALNARRITPLAWCLRFSPGCFLALVCFPCAVVSALFLLNAPENHIEAVIVNRLRLIREVTTAAAIHPCLVRC